MCLQKKSRFSSYHSPWIARCITFIFLRCILEGFKLYDPRLIPSLPFIFRQATKLFNPLGKTWKFHPKNKYSCIARSLQISGSKLTLVCMALNIYAERRETKMSAVYPPFLSLPRIIILCKYWLCSFCFTNPC